MNKKTKLIRQIFPAFLVIVVLSLSAVASYSTSYFKSFFLENSEKELMVRAKLLQNQFADILAADPQNIRDINDQCKNIGDRTGTRVTVILPSGTVIGDSFGETDLMENHLTRPEIMTAFKGKEGISRRYSSTLDKTMLYIALPVIKDGTVIAVVRTSLSVSVIDDKIRSVRNSIFLAMLATILLAAVVSLLVSRHLTRPMEEMKKGAAEFAKGNLNSRMAVPDSEELAELAITMNHMAESLDEKIKTCENRTRELEAVHVSMQEGVIAIDKDQRIITINQAAAKIFGFAAHELKGRYILEAARNVEFQRFIQNALETHDPMEEDILISGDEDLILNIHSSALYDNRNRRMGTLMIVHDITRIRRLEKMHKEFAANVSHELKTPLTSIQGFIETLQEMLLEKNTEEAGKFLNIIEKRRKAAEYLNSIFKNVRGLLIPKLDSAEIKTTHHLYLLKIDPSVLKGDIQMLKQKLTKKGITQIQHFAPLYKFSIMKQLGYDTGKIAKSCPNAEEAFSRTFTHLPLYDFDKSQLDYLADAVIKSVKEM